MEWRKPDDYPEKFEDVLILYKTYTGFSNYAIGWYDGLDWRTSIDEAKKCLAWMPLPPKPNFEKDEKEN